MEMRAAIPALKMLRARRLGEVVNATLGISLERILYLLMAAVSKGVEFLAGVARVYRVVGTMGMDRQGAGANIAYVLCINDATDGSFRSCIAALDDFPS